MATTIQDVFNALLSAILPSYYHAATASKMHPESSGHTCIGESSTSHPQNPIPEEPPSKSIKPEILSIPAHSTDSSSLSIDYTSSSGNESPSTPATDPQLDEAFVAASLSDEIPSVIPPSTPKRRRASTLLISQSPEDKHRILSSRGANTKEVEKVCCGGGCCFLNTLEEDPNTLFSDPINTPDNDAFRGLKLRLGPLSLESNLTNVADSPPR